MNNITANRSSFIKFRLVWNSFDWNTTLDISTSGDVKILFTRTSGFWFWEKRHVITCTVCYYSPTRFNCVSMDYHINDVKAGILDRSDLNINLMVETAIQIGSRIDNDKALVPSWSQDQLDARFGITPSVMSITTPPKAKRKRKPRAKKTTNLVSQPHENNLGEDISDVVGDVVDIMVVSTVMDEFLDATDDADYFPSEPEVKYAPEPITPPSPSTYEAPEVKYTPEPSAPPSPSYYEASDDTRTSSYSSPSSSSSSSNSSSSYDSYDSGSSSSFSD